MSNCPNDAEVFAASLGPHGNGGPAEDNRPVRNALEEADAIRNDQQKAQAQRVSAIVRVNALLAPDNVPPPPGNAVNAADTATLRRSTRILTSMVNDAARGKQDLVDAYENAYAYASGTTVADTSKWFDMVNSLFGRLVNDRASFYKFVATYFKDPSTSLMGNRVIQEFELMQPKITGIKQGYERQHKAILDAVAPIAKRIGIDAESLAAYIGHYANARHMPERNQYLLQVWDADLAAAQLAGDMREVLRLQEQRMRLTMFIDDLDPPEDALTAGMTNAQARKVMADVIDRGVTREEAERISDMFTGFSSRILQDLIDAGLISPDELATFPPFEYYLPVKTKGDNVNGPMNDVTGYNPGRFHAIQGRTSTPDSAYYSVLQYARRAANMLGTRDFGLTLAALDEYAQTHNMDVGLRSSSYNEIVAATQSSNYAARTGALNLLNSGFVVDVPVADLDGRFLNSERRVFYFDREWRDDARGLSGETLANTLQNTGKVNTGFERAARLTSLYSQMFTRFQPIFAPVNTFRDTGERFIHMLSREYYNDATGERISGARLAGAYVVNTPRAGFILIDALNGDLEPGSAPAQYWNEYQQYGLYQKFMQRTRTERLSLDDVSTGRTLPQSGVRNFLDERGYEGVKWAIDASGATMNWVIDKLDRWNDYWNNIASFNQFMTLRENGVDVRSAAHGTLELMNLYQSGSWTPMLRTLFPFVKPTMQGGMAMMRSLGITGDAADLKRRAPRAAATILGGYAALTALMPLIKAGMGDDEQTGMNRLDQMSLSELQRALPIGDGTGSFVKLPYGFGIGQIITTLAFGMDRVERGLMSPNDFAFELLFALFDNTSPTGKPNFDISKDPLSWVMQALSPAVATPVVQAATNRNFWGGKITWATNEDERPAAAQGRLSTPRFWHDVAKSALSTTGYDLAPEQWKTLADGLLVGPLRILQGTLIDEGTRRGHQEGSARETLGPVLSTLGMTMFYGEKHATNQALFYNALDRYVSEIRRENIDVKLPRDLTNASAEAKEDYISEQLRAAGKSEDFIDDYLVLRAARSALRSTGQKFSQSMRNTWLSATDTSELKEEFMALAEQENDVYAEVINSLNYYNDAR